jgi:hypothetical protein
MGVLARAARILRGASYGHLPCRGHAPTTQSLRLHLKGNCWSEARTPRGRRGMGRGPPCVRGLA